MTAGESAGERERLARLFELTAGITWIQVVSAQGAIDDAWRGTSDSVTNPADRKFLLAARSQADLIVTSARTADVERYRPSRFAPILIIDRSVSDTHTELTDDELLPGALLRLNEGQSGAAMAARQHVLLESGPTLARALLQSRRDWQILLTVTGLPTTLEAEDIQRLCAARVRELAQILECGLLATRQIVIEGSNAYLRLETA